MSPRIERVTLSVGLNMNFADNEELIKAKFFLEIQKTMFPQVGVIIEHMQALEGLIDVEKYATLSNMANDMRNHLAEIRLGNSDDFNRGYQRAINLTIDKLEDIDIDSQAATSISEVQAAMLLNAAELVRSQEDYAAIVNLAKSVNDGCV